jgi:hypothetical protein
LTPDDLIYRMRVRDRFVTGVFELEITEKIDPDKIFMEA